MLKIGNYKPGYDLSLLNTIYHYPRKQKDGKWSSDCMDLIIRDNKTGDKFLETIEKPVYDYFMVNEDEFVDHNLFFIEKEKTHRITVPYSNLLFDIAERTNNVQFFKENLYNGNRYNNNRLHTVKRVMMSDSDIEDHYRWKFSLNYQNEMKFISKSYLDIEVDSINAKGDFVEPGECPINAVSIVNDESKIVHTFLLRNPDNPLIEKFEYESKSKSFMGKVREFIINAIGGKSAAAGMKVDVLDYKFHYFDEEIELIKTLFEYINTSKPDFVLAWNMAFDIPYIIQRIKNLGYLPEDIICHPDFRYKEASYYVDERNKNDFAERGDYAKISSYSVYLDQLIHFASRRKGRAALASYRLDYIGEITCGVKKLDYKNITNSLTKLPYVDYWTFVMYNIIDTIVQYCIEGKVNDIGNAYHNVLLNNTKWPKIYRQTIYLHNRAIRSFWNSGFVMGNNCNKDTPKVKFPGAFVADPSLNSSYSKMTLNGKPVSIFNNADDFDFAALYPSITSEFNMAPHTIIGHLNIPNKIYEFENRFNNEEYKYKREGQFMDDLQCHVWIEFFHRWFKFASYSEMYDDVIEYFTRITAPSGKLNIHDSRGRIPLFKQIPENKARRLFIPIMSERDKKIIESSSSISIPTFKFDDKITCFNDVYNFYQKNKLERKN